MVKISIKKDKKTKTKTKAKPRQKQKQKQSQKVIVNIGSNAVRARRAPTQTLQKKATNNQTPTPNIIVPQAMPQNSNNEILRYIRESEQQKEIIKKQEKTNELEKDKIKAKEKTRTIIPEEEAQSSFSIVNSQNISALTSGTATPLSFPVDYDSLYDSLMRVADLRGENPNSGNVSFSTLQSNPLSSTLSSSNTSIDSYPAQFIRSDGVDTRFESTRETGRIVPTTQSLARLWLNTARQSLADTTSSGSSVLSSNSTAPSIDDLISNTQEPPMPVEEQAIEPEDEEAEQEAEFYDAEEETTEPPEQPTEPLIIEPPQPELVVLNPPQTEAPLLYETEDQTTPPKTEEPRQAEEPIPIAKLPDIVPFEDVIDQFGLKQLGQILIKNKITSEDGYPFFIKDGHVKTTLFNTDTARLRYYQIDKQELKRYLIEANKKGLINI